MLHESARRGDAAHETEMPRIDRSDPALRGEFASAVDRKSHVRVASHCAVIEHLASMRVDEGRDGGVVRDLAKTHVATAPLGIEGFLPRHGETRTRHEGEATLTQRCPRKRPRYRRTLCDANV